MEDGIQWKNDFSVLKESNSQPRGKNMIQYKDKTKIGLGK